MTAEVCAALNRLAPLDYPFSLADLGLAPPVPATLNDNAPVAQIVEGAQEPAGLRLKLSKKDNGSVVLGLAAEPVSTGPRFRALAASVGADNPDFCWGILKQVVNGPQWRPLAKWHRPHCRRRTSLPDHHPFHILRVEKRSKLLEFAKGGNFRNSQGCSGVFAIHRAWKLGPNLSDK
jgi:hypothetical protein